MTTDIAAQETVRSYLATWNATDHDERRRLLAMHWAAECTYVDPMAVANGRDEISAVIAGVHAQFADFVFAPVGDVDAHHHQLRFQWGLGPQGQEPVVIGFDVVVLDPEGRIEDVRGFLDRVPQ